MFNRMPLCGSPVKAQRAVGLGKVVVRANLNWPVCRVLDHHSVSGASARVEGVFVFVCDEFAGCHHLPPLPR
jgi:hypothetical protein